MVVRNTAGNTGLLVHDNEGVSIGEGVTPPPEGLIVRGTSDFVGHVGIGKAAGRRQLEVAGNASKTVAGEWAANSDRRIKTDIQPIGDALEQLMSIRPVTFRYTPEYLAVHQEIEDQVYYNIIAQEFAEIFPDAVVPSGEYLPGTQRTPENEILQVDFHPAKLVTIAAVQELVVTVEALQNEVAGLKAESGKVIELTRRNAELEQRLAKLESLLTGDQRATGAQQ